jgi:hypothetical protein
MPWRQQLAAVRLCEASLRALPTVRLARWATILVTLGAAAIILLLSRSGHPQELDAALASAAHVLTWTGAGLTALGYARSLAQPGGIAVHAALLCERGVSERDIRRARFIAAVRRIALLPLVPALVLALVVALLSPSGPILLARLLSTVAIAAYVVVAALVLAALAGWSASLGGRRAGLTFVGLLLLPHFARDVWPATPSVPALFQWLRDGLLALSKVAP